METIKIPLDSHIWAESSMECPYEMIDRLYDSVNTSELRNYLDLIISYAYYHKAPSKKKNWNLITNYSVFHSILRAMYVMNSNPTVYFLNDLDEIVLDNINPFMIGSLSEEEFRNPFLVFKNILAQKSLLVLDKELYELFFCGNNIHESAPSCNLIEFYLQLVKILDAISLIYLISKVKDRG